jgi:hypothetical protein
VGCLSSLFFGKHLDPLVTGDARKEELTVLVREVGESVLNQSAVIVGCKLLLSDIEETGAHNARVLADAGDFHGAYCIRGGVGCQEETRERSEGVVIERLITVLADLTVDEINVVAITLHTLLVFVHGYIIHAGACGVKGSA